MVKEFAGAYPERDNFGETETLYGDIAISIDGVGEQLSAPSIEKQYPNKTEINLHIWNQDFEMNLWYLKETKRFRYFVLRFKKGQWAGESLSTCRTTIGRQCSICSHSFTDINEEKIVAKGTFCKGSGHKPLEKSIPFIIIVRLKYNKDESNMCGRSLKQAKIADYQLEVGRSNRPRSHQLYCFVLVDSKEKRRLYYEIVEKHHSYVTATRHVGRHIGWLIYHNDELIGCIGIGSYFLPEPIALKKYIGWNEKKDHNFNCNFNKVANNWRFTLMSNAPHNAGSKCLSILAKIAPKAWFQKYGDDLVLIVSLVGAGHEGTCFKAAGWKLIGKTAGSTKKKAYSIKKSWRELGFKKGGLSNKYKVGRKLIFVKPLHPQWKLILTSVRLDRKV